MTKSPRDKKPNWEELSGILATASVYFYQTSKRNKSIKQIIKSTNWTNKQISNSKTIMLKGMLNKQLFTLTKLFLFPMSGAWQYESHLPSSFLPVFISFIRPVRGPIKWIAFVFLELTLFQGFFCIFSGFLNFFWFSSIFEEAVRGPIKWIAFVFLQLTLFHFFCIFSGFLFFLGFLPFLNGFSGGPLNALLLSFYNLHFFRFSSIFKGPRGQISNIVGDGRLADHVDQKYQDPAYLHNIDGSW